MNPMNAASALVDAQRRYHAAKRSGDLRQLVDAELALFAATREVVRTHPETARRFGIVERVFTDGPKFPHLRPKLVEICLRASW